MVINNELKHEHKEKIFIKIFGSQGLEAYFLDSFLMIFEDGQPRDNLP